MTQNSNKVKDEKSIKDTRKKIHEDPRIKQSPHSKGRSLKGYLRQEKESEGS